MKLILVTGSTGFIGKVLVPALLAGGYSVKALTRYPQLSPFSLHKNLSVVKADITNRRSLLKTLSGVHAIIHLAVNKYDPHAAASVNVDGINNLLWAMEKKGVRRIINVSTQSAKISIKGVYARTKAQSDALVEASSASYTTLRVSTIYGDDPASLFKTIVTLAKKLPVIPIFGDGTWKSFPISLDDLCQLIVLVLKTPHTARRTFDVGGGQGATFDEIIKEIEKSLGLTKPIIHIPSRLGLFLARSLMLIMHNPPITPDNMLGSTQDTSCNPLALLRLTGFTPQPWKKGVQALIAPPNNKRIAIIGLGKMGTLHSALLTVLSKRYPIEITALVDKSTSLATTAKSMGLTGTYYPSVEAMLAQNSIDIAFVATPTNTHKTIVLKLISKGVDVFVEKPLTTSYADTLEIVSAARRNKRLVGVGYFYPFRPTFARFMTIVNYLRPQITSCKATALHSEVLAPKKGWLFHHASSGGGVLINPAAHALSVLLRMFGLPKAVEGHAIAHYSQSVEDEVWLAFSYTKRLTCTMHASWSVPDKPLLETRITIKGTFGSISVTEKAVFMHLVSPIQDLSLPKGNTIEIEDDLIADNRQSLFIINKHAGGVGYFLQDQAFVEAVLSGKPFLNDVRHVQSLEKAFHMAYQSINENKRITA